MFKKYIPETTVRVIKRIKNIILKYGFYLAGGTSLSLHLGHRYSKDLDFFNSQEFDSETLSSEILKLGGKIIYSERDTVHSEIDKTLVSMFYYPYPLLYPLEYFEGIPVASLKDVAAMKLLSLSQRAEKKDYFDIVFIMKNISIRELKDLMIKKFSKERLNWYHITKSLFFFEDVESSPDPICEEISWDEVKRFLLSKRREIESIFLE